MSLNTPLIIGNDSAGNETIDFKISDKSLGPADISLFKTKAINATTTTELLTHPLILEEGDVLKATASTANTIHVICSLVEIS